MAQNDVIVYKFEDLESCSARIGQVFDALENIKTVSDQVKNRVNNYWQGKAADGFLNRFNTMITAVDKLSCQIEKSQEKLDKAIRLQTENEESLKGETVGRLSPEDLF